MNTQDALQKAETLLQPIATGFTHPAANRLDAVVTAAQLPAAVGVLVGDHWGYLSAVTGLDQPPAAPKAGEPAAEGGVEALYHFCEGDAIATLRVRVPYAAATIPSICHLIPSATLYERELSEMLGVTVAGTPDTDHLLLPDEWPAGVYPLR
ncbi:MAG: NADH-quinone oxidoreductase subunit C, partial [Bacteroidales bacterium]